MKKLGLPKRRYRMEMSGDYLGASRNADFPEDADGRCLTDKKFGWVHPCCSFPLSGVELAVYPTE